MYLTVNIWQSPSEISKNSAASKAKFKYQVYSVLLLMPYAGVKSEFAAVMGWEIHLKLYYQKFNLGIAFVILD